ncbi:MAG TPA: hypothetical protein VGJ00_04880 [Rhabdochlamydiaceae bacterium]|jgi:hypothetical protein
MSIKYISTTGEIIFHTPFSRNEFFLAEKNSLGKFYQEHPQPEFGDRSICKAREEFWSEKLKLMIDRELSIISGNIFYAKETLESCKPESCKPLSAFPISHVPQLIQERYDFHLKTLKSNSERLEVLKDQVKFSHKHRETFKFLPVIMKKNKDIQIGIEACNYYYAKIHQFHAESINPKTWPSSVGPDRFQY